MHNDLLKQGTDSRIKETKLNSLQRQGMHTYLPVPDELLPEPRVAHGGAQDKNHGEGS